MGAVSARATTIRDARPLADAGALLVFSLVGMASHHRLGASGLLRDALPLLAAWFAVAAALRLYRREGARWVLVNWIIAIPLGVLVRALALDRPFDGSEAAFLATTLAFTLLFVAAGRGALRMARNRAGRFH